jgi:hypothetical protein
MLSSFINRRKVRKISLFDAALRRAPSPPSSEIQSDHDNSRSKQSPSPPKAQAPSVTSLRSSALRRQSSPKVHLDFIPSSSNDWFPQEIFAPYDEDGHLPVQPVPQSSTSPAWDDVVVIGPEQVSIFLSPRLAYPDPPKPPLKPKPSPAFSPLPVIGRSPPIELGHDVCSLLFHANTLTQPFHHYSRPPPRPYHGNLHRRQL